MKLATPSAVPLIPVGTLVLVRLDDDPSVPAHVWEIIEDGKAILVDEHYPHGETEDIENFAPANIYTIGTTIPF